MGSFNGQSFGEFGQGPGGPYPSWPSKQLLTEQIRPNNDSALADIGGDVPRFTLTTRCTQAEYLALMDQVLEVGSLVFGLETVSALLCGITRAEEHGAGKDVYIVDLDVIRVS